MKTQTSQHAIQPSSSLSVAPAGFGRTAAFFVIPAVVPTLLILSLLLDYDPYVTVVVVVAVTAAVFPIFDGLSGKFSMLPQEQVEALRKSRKERANVASRAAAWPLVLAISLQIALVFLGMYEVSKANSKPGLMLYAVLLGFTATPSYTHELYHLANRTWGWVAKAHLWITFFLHDERNHMLKHHNTSLSCLPDDPAVARRGETVYGYFFRWQIGTFVDMWKFFAERTRAKGKSPYGLRNYMVALLTSYAILISSVLYFFGVPGLTFLFLHAFVTQVIFAVVTYSQHYGLARLRKPDGTFERFSVLNVWSINSRFFGYESFSVAMHAHHHLDPAAPYYELVHVQGSPIVPVRGGYYGMMLAIIISPLWFHYMNPLVDDLVKQREALLAGSPPARQSA